MNNAKKRLINASLTTSALIVGSLVIPSAASATSPPRCSTNYYYVVSKVGGPKYKSAGPTAGKKNASRTDSTPYKYAKKTINTRSTKWDGEAGGSLGWGIAKVEAKTSYEITKTSEKGETVTNTMIIPPQKRGYTTPMTEFQKFHIEEWVETEGCDHKLYKDKGVLNAITASIYFAECISKDPCTPKP